MRERPLTKITSVILAVVMLVSTIPAALAEEVSKVSASTGTDTVDEYLTAYYSFDDAADLGKDSSDYKRDAAEVVSVTSAEGISGGAAYFSGGSNGTSYMRMNEEILDGAESFTLSFWTKRDSGNGNSFVFSLLGDEIASAPSNYIGFINKDSGTTKRTATEFRKNGSTTSMSLSEQTVQVGEWAHYALSYDAEAKLAVMYINGEEVLSQEGINAKPSDYTGTLNYIARSLWTADDDYMGTVDEVKLYSKALSWEELYEKADVTVTFVDKATGNEIKAEESVLGAVGFEKSATDEQKEAIVYNGGYYEYDESTPSLLVEGQDDVLVLYFNETEFECMAPTVFGEHTYQVFFDEIAPDKAEEYCEDLGGYLAAITSQDEQDFIAELSEEAYDCSSKTKFFIGGTDFGTEGVWRWMNGETWSYTSWSSSSEPNNGNGSGEDYVIVGRDRDWDWLDVYGAYDNYTAYSGFICEWSYVTEKVTSAEVTVQFYDRETGAEIKNAETITGAVGYNAYATNSQKTYIVYDGVKYFYDDESTPYVAVTGENDVITLYFEAIEPHARKVGELIQYNDTDYVIMSDNLITNGDFEEGFTDWQTCDGEDMTSETFTLNISGGSDKGQYVTSKMSQNNTSPYSLYRKVEAEPSTLYYHSYYIKSDDQDYTDVKYIVSNLINDDDTIGQESANDATASGAIGGTFDNTFDITMDKWTKIETVLSGTENAKYFVMNARWLESISFDEVGLYKIAEAKDVLTTAEVTVKFVDRATGAEIKSAETLGGYVGYETSATAAQKRRILYNGVNYRYDRTSTSSLTATGSDDIITLYFNETDDDLEGMLLWYEFDDEEDLGIDSSGCEFDAAEVVSVTSAEGISGGAACFSGGSNGTSYIRMNEELLDGVESFTLSFWTKRDSENGNSFVFSLLGDEIVSSPSNYIGFINKDSGTTKCTAAEFRKNGSTTSMSLSEQTVQVGEWAHYALSYDADAQLAVMYINGEEVLSQEGVDAKPSDYTGNLNYIARSLWTADDDYMGTVDEVKLYSKALSWEDLYEKADVTVRFVDKATGNELKAEESVIGAVGFEKSATDEQKEDIVIYNGGYYIYDETSDGSVLVTGEGDILTLYFSKLTYTPVKESMYNGNNYELYYNLSVTWEDAEAYCESCGGHLAVITDLEEYNFIEEFRGSYCLMWIGGYRDDEFNWYWVTGEEWDFYKWASGQPDNAGSENRLTIWPGGWNDLNNNNTSQQYGFICEYETAYANRISINVYTPDGTALTDGYTVKWYVDGSDDVISTGNTLYGAEEGTEYKYEVILGEDLSFEYYAPDSGTAKPGDELSVTLMEIEEITVSGNVANADGEALDNLSVWATQTAGEYSKRIDVTVNDDGSFGFNALNITTIVYASADKCYTGAKVAVSGQTDEDAIVLDTITLKSLPENRITLSVTQTTAAADGETGSTSSVLSFDNISFTLYNLTEGKAVSDFDVQYPYIMINEDVNAGDEIAITANADGCGEATVSVTLSELLTGSATIELTENGQFHTSGITAINGMYVMVFDENGNLVSRYIPASTSFYSDSMPDGSYTVVFLEKNAYLRSVSTLSKFDDYSLSEGEDYAAVGVDIETGVISDISDISVPTLDTSKLVYTVSETTSVSINKTEIVTGNLTTVRAEYEMDDKNTYSGEKIMVEIPEGMDIVNGSVTLDGKAAVYSIEDGIMTVAANKSAAVLRFYTSAYEAGSYDMSVSLGFKMNGDDMTQPLGTVRLSATALTMTVPVDTADGSVSISGKTISKSTITVYDGVNEVGTTTANALGTWQLTFDLVNKYKYSNHVIWAKVESYISDITSEYYLVMYDPDLVDVSKVTMINTAHPTSSLTPTEYETVFDFKHPSAVAGSYKYWPSYPDFTFKIEFDGDTDEDEDVTLQVHTEDGGTTELEATKDTENDVWIATGTFLTGARPVNVSVITCPTGSVTGISTDDFNDALSAEKNQTLTKITTPKAELVDSKTGTYIITEGSSGGGNDTDSDTDTGTDSDNTFVYKPEYDTIDSDDFEPGDNYFDVTFNDGGTIYFGVDNNGDGTLTGHIVTDLETAKKLPDLYPESAYADKFAEADANNYFDNAVTVGEAIEGLLEAKSAGDVANTIFDAIDNFRTSAGNRDAAKRTLCVLMRVKRGIKTNLEDAGRLSLAEKELERITELRDYFKDVADFLSDINDIIPNVDAQTRILKAAINFGNDWGWNAAFSKVSGVLVDFENKYKQTEKELATCPDGCLCGSKAETLQQGIFGARYACCTDKCYKRVRNYSGSDDNIEDDPSGYVYEAVPSNRVEGVTVTAYVKTEVTDSFGEPTGEYEDVLWDAADYDQANPLITDEYGMYAWDVTSGDWVITYEKEGYITTDSRECEDAVNDGYLPVPPPQTEVNVGIVSLLAPEVKAVNIYSDSVRIEFTQYMELESVNAENVVVTLNGSAVSGTIEPLNAEENYDGSAEYASIFSFVPTSEMSGIASVEIKNAVNYAGRAMESAFTASASVVPAPTGIDAVESVTVGYNSSALVEINVLEGDAGKNVTLMATSSSPSIVSVVNETAVTDENGKATIALSGNLPGSGEITVTIDGTDISWTIAATVGGVVTTERCSKVTASVESGSVVEKGTKIELSSSTSGAAIYYTTDGTDPTTSETKTLYTGAIEITADTVILAYAEKDGLDPSGTAGFAYTIEKTDEATGSLQMTLSNIVGGTLIAAAYDEEGTMLFARMFDAEAAEQMTITLENVLVSDVNKMKTMKVFQWSADGSMQPLAGAVSVTLE